MCTYIYNIISNKKNTPVPPLTLKSGRVCEVFVIQYIIILTLRMRVGKTSDGSF